MKSPYLRVVLFVYASALTASWPRYRLPDAGHYYAVAYAWDGWRGIYLTYNPTSPNRHTHAATPYYLSVVVASPDHTLIASSYREMLAGVVGDRTRR